MSAPHVNELPLRQRLRIYLAGAGACEEYELSRENEILRELLDRVIEEGIHQWHHIVNDEPHLPSWLGLTESEYAAYVEGGVRKMVEE